MNLNTYYEKCSEIIRRTANEFSVYVGRYRDFCAEVTRNEYCLGSDGLHRGAYCPSLIQDIVIGKTKRGRLTGVCPRNKVASFVYGFDSNGRLLTVDDPFAHEILVYEDQVEVGISFYSEFGIFGISECTHDPTGRLAKYATYLLSADRCCVIDSTTEEYTYEENRLLVDMYLYSQVVGLTHERYVFSLVDGYLSSYTIEHYSEGKRVPDIWDGRVWPVSIKRKVLGE